MKRQETGDEDKDSHIDSRYRTRHKWNTLYLDRFGSNNIGKILLGHLRTAACRDEAGSL